MTQSVYTDKGWHPMQLHRIYKEFYALTFDSNYDKIEQVFAVESNLYPLASNYSIGRDER